MRKITLSVLIAVAPVGTAAAQSEKAVDPTACIQKKCSVDRKVDPTALPPADPTALPSQQ